MKNKFCFFILFVVVILGGTVSTQAQTKVYFDYDDAGNRIERSIINLSVKSATITQDNSMEELIESFDLHEVHIYPNPTKGVLKIDFPSMPKEKIYLRIHNLQGKLLISKSAQSSGNTLDLSSYPSGFYILLIETETEKKEWKIIKD